MRSWIARSLGLITVVLLAASCGTDAADEPVATPDTDTADVAEDPEPEGTDEDTLAEVATPDARAAGGAEPGTAIVEIGGEVVVFRLICERAPVAFLVAGESVGEDDWTLTGLFRGDPAADVLGVRDGRTETEWGIAPSQSVGSFDTLTVDGATAIGAGTFGVDGGPETLPGRFEVNCSPPDAAPG